jgi:SAM-dependent methyltransferase
MNESSMAQAAARYWDAHREKSKDPGYWMAHPLCRQAINRRVSGNPHEWPLDWFRRVHGQVSFGCGVSWGCGLGAFERDAMRKNLVREIDAFDISPVSLRDAGQEAQKDGLPGIHYLIGDFNEPRLQRHRYGIVFFHASLHHVSRLEDLFQALELGLKRRGGVYVDEYVGPSRDEWKPEHLLRAQAFLDGLPAEAKVRVTMDLPIERDDPSEAVRSSEIPALLREYFEIIEWRPFGGQLAGLVFPCLDAAWAQSESGCRAVRDMIAIEDQELARDPGASHHLVAFGRLPGWSRLALRRLRRRASRRDPPEGA